MWWAESLVGFRKGVRNARGRFAGAGSLAGRDGLPALTLVLPDGFVAYDGVVMAFYAAAHGSLRCA